MADISKFECSKCGKEFTLMAGLLMSDFKGVSEESALPGGGKPTQEERYNKVADQKAPALAERASKFNASLIQHRKGCDGDVKYTGVMFAD